MSPLFAYSIRNFIGNIIEGGLASLGSCVRKSAGTVLSASGPLIYSLGIHPLGFIVLNQCERISVHKNLDH